MSDCIFCKIIKGEIPSKKVMENEDLFTFRDINPQAPVHVLIVPKQHLPTLNDLDAESAGILPKLFLAAKELAKKEGIAESGYRTVFNCNKHACQSVFHLHLHLLGGKQMGGSMVG